jgi:hypothetical protein
VRFLLAAAMRLPGESIERLTEGLISSLDAIDGDPDLEPEEDRCEAGDDGCAPVWVMGRRHWGSGAEQDSGV